MTASLSAGTKLGRYEIMSNIGAGGMGEVYLAEDTSLRRRVSLKVLPITVAADNDRMRRFRQEATAAASLNHPNIAHIYEIGETEGTNFIAMEYVDGVTLRHKIHDEDPELSRLLRQLQHVAEGLAKAHASGIVHRDLKPDNIMISHDGHAKILDFGLAKLIEGRTEVGTEDPTIVLSQDAPAVTSPGLILGTSGYMSPEQAQGKTREIDNRSDIFSFGCILFEAITGQKAFKGSDTIDTLNKIIRESPPSITSLNPSAPPDLQRIVRRCLAKDPDERYQNIKEVAIELRDVRRGLQEPPADERTPVEASDSEAKTLWSDDVTRLQSKAGTTAGLPSSPSTRASSAEFIVNGLRRHKLIVALVVIILAVAALGVNYYIHSKNTEVAVDSIAVIPFANESNDQSADWISDGLTESIINSLTQLPNLKVIARSSVFRYKGKETDPIMVGKELGVRAVLVGRLQQRGDSMFISAELVDVRDNKQLWGEQYERKLADMLSVQREIARQMTSNLRPTLSGMEEAKANKQYTANPEAYQMYLKGRFYWNKRTPADFEKAIGFFQEAIGKDPNYAMAYSGLADSYALKPAYTNEASRDVMPKARAAAERALELDPNLAEAHASLGQIISYYDYDFPAAEKEFQKAIQLNPNYASAHQWYGEQLSALNRTGEALAELQRALDLDPLSVIVNRIYADVLVDARRFDEAIEQFQKTIDLDPNFSTTYYFVGRAYEAKGMYDKAVENYGKSASLSGMPPEALARVKTAYERSGWKGYLQASVNELEAGARVGKVPAWVISTFYARLGKPDEAMNWLQKAYDDRDFRVGLIGVSFEFDSMRSDPRFIELTKRLGLPRVSSLRHHRAF
jgi:serine/threonine protein kinase/tetratricopeptide (TPR) repeat protein